MSARFGNKEFLSDLDKCGLSGNGNQIVEKFQVKDGMRI